MAERIRTGPDWDDVRVFAALARHGSLSGAARALSLNHATIARRLAALERSLGAKLVERRPDGYVLTPAGQRTLGIAAQMEQAAAGLGRDHAAGQPTGLVRVNATPSLAQGFLMAHLAGFAARHPGLDIEITSDMRAISLERREADIALRLGRPEDGDVIARRLLAVGYGFYATPAWCRRMARGATPVFIGFDEANAQVPEAVWLAQHFPRSRVALRAEHYTAQAIAAKAGAGIALLPHFVGRTNAGLRPCLPEQTPPTRELWMITRRQDRLDPAIHAVTGYLRAAFEAACERSDAGDTRNG